MDFLKTEGGGGEFFGDFKIRFFILDMSKTTFRKIKCPKNSPSPPQSFYGS